MASNSPFYTRQKKIQEANAKWASTPHPKPSFDKKKHPWCGTHLETDTQKDARKNYMKDNRQMDYIE